MSEDKKTITMHDSISGYFLNCYSILMYLIAVLLFIFPSELMSNIWPLHWAGPVFFALMGPIGSWGMCRDIKKNQEQEAA